MLGIEINCCTLDKDLLALNGDVYSDFVNFPFGILGQVWYLIVSIPDPCSISYFEGLTSKGNFFLYTR